LDEIGEELTAPAYPAFEESKIEIGEAPRNAAEEQRLGHGVAGGGEVADMVICEIARRIAQAEAAAPSMEGRCNFELAAFLPDRVVVVIAVEAELVIMRREASDGRVGALGGRQGPANAATEHPDLRTQLLRDEFELRDRLIGSVHRDHRRRGHM